MLKSLPMRALRVCRGLQSTAIRCTSNQGSATARLEHVEIDGKEFLRDDKWNLSPYVLKLLERQLLFEPSNPLALLKQRLINFFHKEYRKPGNRTPLYTVCDREPRVVTVFDNFDSLLVPSDHVSRKASDTYYVNANHCLRAHTSAHQFNLIKQGLDNFLVIGDVYRRDEINKTHYPCFHQVEGVRLYSRDELFGTQQRSDLKLFDNGERTKEKQETHMEDTAKALEISLKATLEQLCDAFFGKNCEKRWVDAYFPFTHPSFELEVFYEGKWLEVLGCGVMEQKLLQNAGVDDKVGWAFGIGLERIAMVLYGIPDIRLFWSCDSGFTSQFAGKTSEDDFKYKPISMYPQVLFDLSFFLPDGCQFNDMTANVYDLIRTIGGDLIEQVELTDEFFNKKSSKKSQTYRIVYRSNERVLSKEEVNLIHKEIEKQLVQQHNVTIR